jgi:beta-N-acetylhexosaminidase
MCIKEKYVNILAQMSLREKIGQTVVILANMNEFKQNYGSIEAFLEKYPVGGLYIGAQAWLNPDEKYGMDWFIAANEEYRSASKFSPFIVEDMENGPGFLLPELPMLPHLMALGATNSEELAYEYGKSIAYGAHSLGIHWLLNPVADINVNPFSPSTNARALSDNPELVAKLIVQVVKGIEENGVACCLKHFPGDGVDFREQHAVTSYNKLSANDWMESYGYVYKEAFKAGASSVMTGHIALPAYQTQKIDGRYPPATLSKDLSTDLINY